jgi:hypothetical protein
MTTTEITFDKLLYVDRLKSGGLTEEQARSHAEALDLALRDKVATKQDPRQEISTVRQEISALRQELKDDIRDLRTEMQTEFRNVRAEIARLGTKFDNTIALAVRDIKIRFGGITIVAFGALASIKFFG